MGRTRSLNAGRWIWFSGQWKHRGRKFISGMQGLNAWVQCIWKEPHTKRECHMWRCSHALTSRNLSINDQYLGKTQWKGNNKYVIMRLYYRQLKQVEHLDNILLDINFQRGNLLIVETLTTLAWNGQLSWPRPQKLSYCFIFQKAEKELRGSYLS